MSDPTDHFQNAIIVQETILYKPMKVLGENFHILICIRCKLSKSYILKTVRVIY